MASVRAHRLADRLTWIKRSRPRSLPWPGLAFRRATASFPKGPRASAKGLAVRTVEDSVLPPALKGDAGRIRQMMETRSIFRFEDFVQMQSDTYSLRAFRWKAMQLLDYAAALKLDTVQISSSGDYESLEPAHLARVKEHAATLGIVLDAGIVAGGNAIGANLLRDDK